MNVDDKTALGLARMLEKEFSSVLPANKSHYSRAAWNWAVRNELLVPHPEREGRFRLSGSFWWGYLPPLTVWSIVDKIIGDKTGRSIAKDARWNLLGIWNDGSRHQSDRDRAEMLRVMMEMDAFHFIIFQSAGDVWVITRQQKEGQQ